MTEISLFWTLIRIPIATEWILVRSTDAGELRPLHFVFDGGELDSSISDVELLRSELAVNRPRINDVQRLYSDEGDLSPSALAAAPIAHLTNDRLESELNEGQHLVVLSGHGNWPGCCGFDPWMAQRITNGGHTFIAYADSCLTAMYDEPGCLAAALTAGVSQGAVAYIGNSRFSWIGVGCQLQRDFFARWSYTTHAGLMLDLTRTSWANSAYHRWAALALNLMGCPEMPIWRDDQDAAPYWVGNRRTLELHERRCPWVGRMSTSNMRRFASAEQGLAAGYDGCGFCMREHHHR